MSSRAHLILKLAREQQPSDYDNITSPSSQENDKFTAVWKVKAPTSSISADALDTVNASSIPVDVKDHEQGSVGNTTSTKHENYTDDVLCCINTNRILQNEVILSNPLPDKCVLVPKHVNGDESSFGEASHSEPFDSDDSIADPNFSSASSSSSGSHSEEDSDISVQKNSKIRVVSHHSQTEQNTRKRKSNKENWQKNSAKRLRNSGQSYKSFKTVKNNDGTKERLLLVREAKQMLPPCTNKCRLKCFEKFTEMDRQKIFKEYWEMGELQRQRDFISSCMEAVTPKYRYQNPNSFRSLNRAFHLNLGDEKHRVCKLFFMATLGINSRIIRTVQDKQESNTKGILNPEMRGKHGKHATVSEDIKNNIRMHINKIPRIESHYCRSETKKEYIEGGKTIAELYRDYKHSCEEQNISYSNYLMYYSIFNTEYNIGFFNPKKDQCEVCLAFHNANADEKTLLQEKYDIHIKEKEFSRIEKEKDKTSESVVAVYDLQAVLPCPTGNASSYYYTSKLNVLNLTVYELATNEVTCYVWHEGQGQRGANEIGSCVWRYLNQVNNKAYAENKVIDVIFYSDNCTGQNKNKCIFALYMFAILKLQNIKSITHKYLISGHTQNEGDSAHSVIERHIQKFKKSSPIHVPEQYVTLIRQAKKNGKPYSVEEMCYEDFFDLKKLVAEMGINNIFKNSEGEVVKITDMKVFMVKKDQIGQIFYKNSYQQEEFYTANIVNSRRKRTDFMLLVLNKAYQKKLEIAETKKNGILSLIDKKVIPRYYYAFYNNL